MVSRITAYRLYTESLEDHGDISEGDMVRVDEDAIEDASIDVDDWDEELDDEYNYEQYGYVMEIHEDDFRWYDEDEDAAIDVEVGDDPVYIVGMSPLEAGAHPFEEDVLTLADEDEILDGLEIDPDPADAEEELEEAHREVYGDLDDILERTNVLSDTEELVSTANVPGITRNQMGLQPWPYSWRNSNKPARLIAMDAWLSMGRSFRGCRRSVIGSIRNPNRFCAAFKDAIYGHTYWREGGG